MLQGHIQTVTTCMSALNYPEECKHNLRCFWTKLLMRLHTINGGIHLHNLPKNSIEYM